MLPDCERANRELPTDSRLYVATRAAELEPTLRGILEGIGTVVSPEVGVLALDCSRRQLSGLSELCGGLLDARQRSQIKCLLADSDRPSTSDFMHTLDFDEFLDWVDGHWVHEVVCSNRLVTHFQPIISNQTPHHVFAYECLLRGVSETGDLVSPARLISAARATGLLSFLDVAAQLAAIENYAHEQMDAGAFINFNPRILDGATRHMECTVLTALSTGIEPHRFVFEVVESDKITDLRKLMTIVDFCREAGCGVALDDLGAGYNSLNLMAHVRPDFVKLDISLVHDVDRDPYKARVASKLLELARDLSVKTVVEGVETEGEWQWAIEHGADFSQGFFFARPNAEPPIPQMCVGSVLDNTHKGTEHEAQV